MNRSVGMAYTPFTGYDENADLIFNDRPVGVGRNSARGAPWLTLGGRVGYTIPVGRGAGQRPYRLEIFLQGANWANRPNYIGYTGVMTSPFFHQPTAVMNPRIVRTGVNIFF